MARQAAQPCRVAVAALQITLLMVASVAGDMHRQIVAEDPPGVQQRPRRNSMTTAHSRPTDGRSTLRPAIARARLYDQRDQRETFS
jgi:hypothetical protein